MKKIAVLCLFIGILMLGCSQIEEGLENSIPAENNLEPIVLFCPEDGCGKNLEYLINLAKDSVYCAFFDLDLEKIIDALVEKSNEADVRIIMDDEYYKGQIKGNVRTDNSSKLMHNKFCVIDGRVVWTGSFNPTENGDKKNNNNAIVLYSSLIAQNYKDEFDEMWQGVFGGGSEVKNPVVLLNNKRVENYFCPEDFCEERVRREIRNANRSVYFMTFSFTSEKVADEILFKENIDIKGIFEARNSGGLGSQYERMRGFGLDVVKDKNRWAMHHKVFIIDNETVVTGSYNPTGSGNKRNDENIIIIKDKKIAEKYLQEFEKIFG